jgi:hypothetical protein
MPSRMTTFADSDMPLQDKLLHIAAIDWRQEFATEFRRLSELHGGGELNAAADELERVGLIAWPEREQAVTLFATDDGRAPR